MIYAVVDTETIGFKPPEVGSGVCEISVRIIDENLKEVAHLCSRLNPEAPISAGATAIHGIFDEDVADCPTLLDFVHEHKEWLYTEDKVLTVIAYNAPFDMRFLSPYLPDNVKSIDILPLARKYWPDADNHKMQTLRVIHHIPLNLEDQHTAGGDTDTLLKLMRVMVEEQGVTLAEMQEMMVEAEKPDTFWFGKHKGKKFADVAANDPGYLQWCLKNLESMAPEMRSALEDALKKVKK